AEHERRNICGDDVNLASDQFGCARLRRAEPEIRMQTASHTLKQFLVRFPGGGENPLLVTTETANQAIARDAWIERTRVHVSSRDILRTPDLSGRVARLRGPWFGWHSRQFAVEKNKAFRHVGVIVLGLRRAEPGEIAQSYAGL